MLSVKILGPGCPNCKRVEQLTLKALQELDLEAEVQKVTDPSEIVEMGVMSTPGLAINGQVVCKGRIPSLEEVTGFLTEAAV
ncbi:MAG: thioredoxin family protein [Anaerolineales bacterium]